MSFEHKAVVAHPQERVWEWHERPGAIHRLVPPWQPVTVVKESESLESGTAVLGLPLGLTWTAVHDRAAYHPGRQFRDVLRTPLLSTAGWSHTHRIDRQDDNTTTVTDVVETRVPERLTRSMFAYRTRQLRGDLGAHATLNPTGRKLAVAVTGSRGLIGTALCAFLTTGGHTVIRLVRGAPSGLERQWDPSAPAPDLLDGVDAVVHLAGESIAGRFSANHKEAVRSSRVEPTRLLARLAANVGVETFVSASAIGFYGADRGDEEVDEDSERGAGFLADLVEEWERAAATAGSDRTRVVMVRTGIVQSPAGGALKIQRLLFQSGLGGRLGDGRQWFSWIGLDDMVDVYLRALLDPRLEGPVNAVAPAPVRNAEFTSVLARVLHRPAVVAVPSFGPALLLGREGASEVAEASQRVRPTRLEKAGHAFRYPQLEPALRHVLGRAGE
jgi:uncharacterized protein (TIGR01777 family)